MAKASTNFAFPDNFQLEETELELSATSTTERKCGQNGDLSANAFAVIESDQIRMGEIDSELEVSF